MNLYNQSSALDPFALQRHSHQQRHSINNGNTQYSTNSTPLSSPLSVQSNNESDPNGSLLPTGLVYPSNISSPSANSINVPPYNGSGSFDAASYNNSGYPISPQYPSTQTGSSISSPDGNEFTHQTTLMSIPLSTIQSLAIFINMA